MSTIPEDLTASTGIPTQRLSLDLMTVAEVDALIIQTRRPDWAEDFPQPTDYDAARQFFEAGLLGPAAETFGTRLLREHSTSLVVGTIGFEGVPDEGTVEVTYNVVPSCQGQGYATEALLALAHFALASPEVETIIAYTEPGNDASQSLLLSAGFMPEQENELTLKFTLRRDQLPDATP
ncbi:GNAT family N-acetyltransferase [Arthrobacter sp. zg-Y877]|uniref:GNAT family N-acetyltransferase n=1 Tax=Arthrobacter sp. zg-Y877 TaxID=3049074 RepID=UPI0025A39427|nr:GNAT family N-acetyltransferase [Arthrobacter sp. zg-Y877]MDM7990940.1 GNAT family N-acetyltransferase [Arthrobacter sp. zg-Y877]